MSEQTETNGIFRIQTEVGESRSLMWVRQHGRTVLTADLDTATTRAAAQSFAEVAGLMEPGPGGVYELGSGGRLLHRVMSEHLNAALVRVRADQFRYMFRQSECDMLYHVTAGKGDCVQDGRAARTITVGQTVAFDKGCWYGFRGYVEMLRVAAPAWYPGQESVREGGPAADGNDR